MATPPNHSGEITAKQNHIPLSKSPIGPSIRMRICNEQHSLDAGTNVRGNHRTERNRVFGGPKNKFTTANSLRWNTNNANKKDAQSLLNNTRSWLIDGASEKPWWACFTQRNAKLVLNNCPTNCHSGFYCNTTYDRGNSSSYQVAYCKGPLLKTLGFQDVPLFRRNITDRGRWSHTTQNA